MPGWLASKSWLHQLAPPPVYKPPVPVYQAPGSVSSTSVQAQAQAPVYKHRVYKYTHKHQCTSTSTSVSSTSVQTPSVQAPVCFCHTMTECTINAPRPVTEMHHQSTCIYSTTTVHQEVQLLKWSTVNPFDKLHHQVHQPVLNPVIAWCTRHAPSAPIASQTAPKVIYIYHQTSATVQPGCAALAP